MSMYILHPLYGSSLKIFIEGVIPHPQQPVIGDFQDVPLTFKVYLPQVNKSATCWRQLTVKGVGRIKWECDMGQ